ncbi:hypothetical protein DUNSADRAFT_3314 [Dunaliella salina]|uniref:sn-1-specific diacylglycerol lipase n=1 Tax=Dunaliella salina TaxID=3046 RepID=A0ABQ7FVI6_DUNSA|nr:hypothetical protein DUNSADRAFT_3314 [Dunaliella salina]|eukprot:KAF5826401.1 hypothetical protein DUNSADRAFT_3314 [Dunaliella salina]
MYRAAKKLLECESESILHNKKLRTRKVVFVGHSLVGGVAAIAALLARQSPEWKDVDCFAVTFGAPPLLSEDLAAGCAEYITSYVLDDDPVARLSIANITKALQRLKEYARRDRERDNGGEGHVV